MSDTERNLLAEFFEACHSGGAILTSGDAEEAYLAVCKKWDIEPVLTRDD